MGNEPRAAARTARGEDTPNYSAVSARATWDGVAPVGHDRPDGKAVLTCSVEDPLAILHCFTKLCMSLYSQMNDDFFTFSDVLRLTGAQKNQLIHWTAAGLVRASIREGAGPGRHRIFGYHDVVETAVATELARHGVSLPSIRAALTKVKAPHRPPRSPIDRLVYVMGKPSAPTALWTGTRRDFIDELRHPTLTFGPVGLLVDVGRIVDTLTSRLGEDA